MKSSEKNKEIVNLPFYKSLNENIQKFSKINESLTQKIQNLMELKTKNIKRNDNLPSKLEKLENDIVDIKNLMNVDKHIKAIININKLQKYHQKLYNQNKLEI